MKRIATVFTILLALASASSNAANTPLRLADNAPEQYIVVPGDTLWDISRRFVKEPWRWAEMWRAEKGQGNKPGRLYPGDVILLEHDSSGKPFLRLQDTKMQPKIYSSPLLQAIPPIPAHIIEPFISRPLIVEPEMLEKAARIVATPQDRVFLASTDVAYVENADPDKEDWQVYRNGKALKDPEDDKKILGYEAFYLGSARQIRPGAPATFEIKTAVQEIGRGDRLIPASRPAMIDYQPQKPDFQVDGRIVSIYGGVGSAGRGSIVSFNRGTQDGIAIGHVLAMQRNRFVIQRDEKDNQTNVKIPPERTGLVFVFRTFANVSYALVLQSEGTIEINDYVCTP